MVQLQNLCGQRSVACSTKRREDISPIVLSFERYILAVGFIALLQLLPALSCLSVENETELTDWTNLRISARRNIDAKDPNQAQKDLERALEIADKLGHTSLYRAITLRELADLHLKEKQYDSAIALLLEEKPLVEGIPDCPLSIDNLSMIVIVYAMCGKETEAWTYMNRLKKLRDFSDDQVIGSAFEIATMYRAKGQVQKELDWLRRIEEETSKVRGSDDSMTMQCLLHIADSYYKYGNIDLALRYFLQVARNGMAHSQSFCDVVKPAITGAGTIYHRLGKENLAASLYEETFRSMNQTLSSDDKVYLCSMIVSVSAICGKETTARTYMHQLEKLHGFSDGQVIARAFDIAAMYRSKGQTQKELAWLRRIEEETNKVRGGDEAMTMQCLLYIADRYYQYGNIDLALRYFLRVARTGMVQSRSFDVVKPAITGACTVYHRLHKDNVAESLYEETLRSMNQSLSSDEKVYLYRRLFDTIVVYGSGDERLLRANQKLKVLTGIALRNKDNQLLIEATYEKAVLNVLSKERSPSQLRLLSKRILSADDLNILADYCRATNDEACIRLAVELYSKSLHVKSDQPKIQIARKEALSYLGRLKAGTNGL